MALTHVAIWRNGWQDISLEEAIQNHPGGSVSANSGLFMCRLCHQYVTLVNQQRKYFKHSKENEKSKNCPDYTQGNAAISTNYYAPQATVPLKMIINGGTVSFQIGLYWLNDMKEDDCVTITAQTNTADYVIKPFTYNVSRLNPTGITYLDVGDFPAKSYNIHFHKSILLKFPNVLKGVSGDGCLFDAETGKKLPDGADIIANHDYYLLTRNNIINNARQSIAVDRICITKYNWNVYSVSAKQFDEAAACFFLDYGYILTECPISFCPIWPEYIESPYIINHQGSSFYTYSKGENICHYVYPCSRQTSYPCSEFGKVVCTDTSENCRQQLLSVSRNKAQLKALYLCQENLECKVAAPDIHIRNASQEEYSPNESILPPKRTLFFKSEFDAVIVVEKGGKLINKQMLPADNWVMINDIHYGEKISIIVGLDRIWSIQFNKERKTCDDDFQNQLLKKLAYSTGMVIAVPNELRSMANKFSNFPLIKSWIYKSIRSGKIKKRAYLLLVNIHIKENQHD